MNRFITIPEPITIKITDEEEQDFDFKKFIDALLNMPEWATDYKAIQAANEVYRLAEADAGEVVELHHTSWEKLKSLLENPKNGYGMHPRALRQMVGYFEAVLEAPKEDPKKSKKKPTKVEAAE